MTTKLDIAKGIIKKYVVVAEHGIFDCFNIVGDPMDTLYDNNGLCILICYNYGYFEVFGLTTSEFKELEDFYKTLCDWS